MKHISILLTLFLVSCVKPSYYNTQRDSLAALYTGDLGKSLKELEGNKMLKSENNQTLYQIEKGRLLYLLGNYDDAAKLFIQAELSMEDWKSYHYRDVRGNNTYAIDNRYTIDGSPLPSKPQNFEEAMVQGANGVRGGYGSASTITLKAPMKTNYVCNDYERPLVNYYTALCGIKLMDDKPFVEARRLDEVMQALDTRKFPMNPGNVNYATNPFIPLMSGIFYEVMGEPNDALISYEKALSSFEDNFCFANYGVYTPEQLKKDILALYQKMGFYDKENEFRKRYPKVQAAKNGIDKTAILILEEGFVPVKDLKLAWYLNGVGPYDVYSKSAYSLKTTRITVNRIINKNYNPKSSINQIELPVALINNMDYAMKEVMEKRYIKETTPNPGALSPPKQGSTVNSTETHNFDSRNWMNLPSGISYYRIGLPETNNDFVLNYIAPNGKLKSKTIHIKQQNRTPLVHVFLD